MSEEKLLAERCEQATGPDRELDAAIAKALGLPHGRDSGWCNSENGDYWVVDECAKRFTASLDAAMTLVPEGYEPLIDMTIRPNCVELYYAPDEREIIRGNGETPALALCAAALRSRSTAKAQEKR